MKHLILVGACYLDTILTVPHFPEEDSKLRATTLQVRRGGNCPNTLQVLAQLMRAGPHSHHHHYRLPPPPPKEEEIKLHLVSCLPDAQAAATRKILSSFGDGNSDGDGDGREDASTIDFSHCLYRAGHDEPASSYIIRSAETGSRTIVNFNDLPEMTADESERIADAFAAEQEEGDEWCWHFEGRIPETTLRCIRYLRQALPRSTISVEVEKPNREGLVELAAEADVVFYSRSWAEVKSKIGAECANLQLMSHRQPQSRGYTNPEACLRAEAASTRASLMLCTWGEQGAGALERPGGEYVHHPATLPGDRVSVVDAIGAGDTFIAGMLYGLQAGGGSCREKPAFAVGLATKKVQQEGFAGLVP